MSTQRDDHPTASPTMCVVPSRHAQVTTDSPPSLRQGQGQPQVTPSAHVGPQDHYHESNSLIISESDGSWSMPSYGGQCNARIINYLRSMDAGSVLRMS